MPGMEETSHQARMTERAEPAYSHRGSSSSEGEGEGSDRAFPHVFPLPPRTLVLQLQDRLSQNCAKLLSQAIAAGPQRGCPPCLSQRTKPCDKAES